MKSKKLFNQLFINVVVFVAAVLVVFSIVNLYSLMKMRSEANLYKSSNAIAQAKGMYIFYEQKLNLLKRDLDWRMRRVSSAASTYFEGKTVNNEMLEEFCRLNNIDKNTESFFLINSADGQFKAGSESIFYVDKETGHQDTANFIKQGPLHSKLFSQLKAEKQYNNIGYTIEHQSGRFKLMSFQPTKDGKYIICFSVYNKLIASLVDDIRWRFGHHTKGVVVTDFFVTSDTATYTLSGKKWSPQVALFLKDAITKKKDLSVTRTMSDADFQTYFENNISRSEIEDAYKGEGDHELLFQYVNLKAISPLDRYIILIVADVTSEKRQVVIDIFRYIGFFVLSFVIIVLIIYTNLNKIVGQITDLLESVNHIISGKFDGRAKVIGDNEISQLSANFNLMLDTIEDNYIDLERKVIDRTAEISQKKNEIERQKVSIEKSKNLLEKTNSELQEANEEISVRKKEIEDSILYAQRIQRAILPSKDLIKKLLPDSFVVFMPRNVVSGDFYWVAESAGKVYFAAVDCTGHGVPGAFMSMLGYSQLTYIIKSGFTQPSDILNQLNYNVVNMLNQEGSDKAVVRDGMDISLCCFDPASLQLEFAAAFNPLMIIRNKEVIIIEADKFPIGNYVTGMEVKKFENQKVQLEKGDCLYIFSDGVTDQFGGPQGRKFMMKRLKEFVINTNELSCEVQGKLLHEEIVLWMGSHYQVDDILVFGVKI